MATEYQQKSLLFVMQVKYMGCRESEEEFSNLTSGPAHSSLSSPSNETKSSLVFLLATKVTKVIKVNQHEIICLSDSSLCHTLGGIQNIKPWKKFLKVQFGVDVNDAPSGHQTWLGSRGNGLSNALCPQQLSVECRLHICFRTDKWTSCKPLLLQCEWIAALKVSYGG